MTVPMVLGGRKYRFYIYCQQGAEYDDGARACCHDLSHIIIVYLHEYTNHYILLMALISILLRFHSCL